MGALSALIEIKKSFQATFGSESYKRKQYAAAKRLIAEGRKTNGTVTSVKTCWWIKIRRRALAAPEFPHIIYYTYQVGSHTYQGSKCVSFYLRCPNINETATVFYDKNDPARTAVSLESVPLLY